MGISSSRLVVFVEYDADNVLIQPIEIGVFLLQFSFLLGLVLVRSICLKTEVSFSNPTYGYTPNLAFFLGGPQKI